MILLDQMRNRILRLNGAEKLILLNVLCFILPLFLNTVLFLFNIQTDFYVGWFELSASWSELLFKPWTLVSYSFMHSGFFHLFWNMYLLFFASRLFLNLFTPKTFFNLYFLGVIVGGLTFFQHFKTVIP
jgi:membrane associated rhomboid family serine protease